MDWVSFQTGEEGFEKHCLAHLCVNAGSMANIIEIHEKE